MEVEKTLVNSCGHTLWYRIKTVDEGVDIESDVNGSCEMCTREDAHFKAQVAEVFHVLFDA